MFVYAHRSKGDFDTVKILKKYGVVEVHFLSFLALALGGESGKLHASDALPQRNSSWWPLNGRLFGPHSRSVRSGEEANR